MKKTKTESEKTPQKTPAQVCAEEVAKVLKKHKMVARISQTIVIVPEPNDQGTANQAK